MSLDLAKTLSFQVAAIIAEIAVLFLFLSHLHAVIPIFTSFMTPSKFYVLTAVLTDVV